MGYCYFGSGPNKNKLCCDACGDGIGRKRTCTEKVDGLPYCPAPSLCKECFKKEGGSKKIHAQCKEPADRSRAERAAKQAKLDQGLLLRAAAFGDWHETVPEGWVGAAFEGLNKIEWVLVPEKDWDAALVNARDDLTEFPNAIPWIWHPGSTTKQI